jgi:hypothetical protein
MGQTVDHTVGSIGVELPEGKPLFHRSRIPNRVPVLG